MGAILDFHQGSTRRQKRGGDFCFHQHIVESGGGKQDRDFLRMHHGGAGEKNVSTGRIGCAEGGIYFRKPEGKAGEVDCGSHGR